MKFLSLIRLASCCAAFVAATPLSRAQDTVTIPKARFEELERKEKELEKLKGELSTVKGETARLKREKQEAVAKAAAVGAPAPVEPEVKHIAPAMNTLPPLQKDEIVNALDLSSHYRTDPAAADARYRKHVFKLKGEIVGFDKPMLTRNYHLLLRAADRQMRVVCVVTPPERYAAVFTTQNGTILTGSAVAGGARSPIARIGQTATIEGRCRGLDGLFVEMSGCELLSIE